MNLLSWSIEIGNRLTIHISAKASTCVEEPVIYQLKHWKRPHINHPHISKGIKEGHCWVSNISVQSSSEATSTWKPLTQFRLKACLSFDLLSARRSVAVFCNLTGGRVGHMYHKYITLHPQLTCPKLCYGRGIIFIGVYVSGCLCVSLCRSIILKSNLPILIKFGKNDKKG